MFSIPLLRRSVNAVRRRANRFDLTWRYGLNVAAALPYRMHRNTLSGEAARVLDSLNRDGVAITTAEKLMEGSNSFDLVVAAVEQREKELDAELCAARTCSDR